MLINLSYFSHVLSLSNLGKDGDLLPVAAVMSADVSSRDIFVQMSVVRF